MLMIDCNCKTSLFKKNYLSESVLNFLSNVGQWILGDNFKTSTFQDILLL